MEKFFFLNTQNLSETSVFEVCHAGITYPDPNYNIYRKSSEIYVVEYITDGEGMVLYEGKEYKLKKGDSYILPAGKEHRYYSDKKNPWTKKWFNVSGVLCEKLLSAYKIENKICFSNARIGSLFDEFFNYCSENTDIRSVNEFGAVIFHRIVQRLAASTQNNPQNTEAYRIKNYIDRNIYEKINASSVADYCGFSVSQLGRIFKSEYGETVYSYILNRKIETAKYLLKNSRLSIKEISDTLKFTDEHYFCNIFKNKCGITPGEYRR